MAVAVIKYVSAAWNGLKVLVVLDGLQELRNLRLAKLPDLGGNEASAPITMLSVEKSACINDLLPGSELHVHAREEAFTLLLILIFHGYVVLGLLLFLAVIIARQETKFKQVELEIHRINFSCFNFVRTDWEHDRLRTSKVWGEETNRTHCARIEWLWTSTGDSEADIAPVRTAVSIEGLCDIVRPVVIELGSVVDSKLQVLHGLGQYHLFHGLRDGVVAEQDIL
jgi:hypothetical protein